MHIQIYCCTHSAFLLYTYTYKIYMYVLTAVICILLYYCTHIHIIESSSRASYINHAFEVNNIYTRMHAMHTRVLGVPTGAKISRWGEKQ